MLVRARRPNRPGAVVWFGAAAAAAVVVASVVVGTGHGPDLQQASDTATTSASTTSATTGATTTPRATPPPTATQTGRPRPLGSTPAQVPGAGSAASAPETLRVPVGFGLVSMTDAGGGHLFALGAGRCAAGGCTAVAASADDGRTWSTRATFTDLTTRGPLVTPAGAHQLVGIRFATTQIGYVFGSEVRRTTDAGRSWAPVDVGGRTVLSLETDGSRVWMATAESCVHSASGPRGCSGLQVRTGSVTSSSTQPVAVGDTPAVAENAWIAMDGPDAYLNATTADPRKAPRATRVSGAPEALAVPQGCSPAQGLTLTATANTRGTLVGICPSAGDPAGRYSVVTSTDRGGTWRSRPAPGLGTPTDAGVWLTATDADHLVAVRRALPASTGEVPAPTTMLSSSTGGATWREVAPGGSDAAVWAGAAGGGLVYAFSGGSSYWLSSDAGSTFETVPLRR